MRWLLPSTTDTRDVLAFFVVCSTVVLVCVALFLTLGASGRNCCTDRAILAAGVEAAHETLDRALVQSRTGQLPPGALDKYARRAQQQMEDAARAAGIELEQPRR